MKLFLSALLLAALPAASAQNQPDPSSFGIAVMQRPNGQPSQAVMHRLDAEAAKQVAPVLETGCPLYLSTASVASPAGYLPVDQRTPEDGALTLHFRNQSGKVIRSASVTATVSVKANIYDLDAHSLVLQLTFSGTDDVNRDQNQLTQIELPRHYYLFGVARVRLDRVTFADGKTWTAPPQNNYCRTHGQGIDRIEAK